LATSSKILAWYPVYEARISRPPYVRVGLTVAALSNDRCIVTVEPCRQMILGMEMEFVKDLFPDAASKKTIRVRPST